MNIKILPRKPNLSYIKAQVIDELRNRYARLRRRRSTVFKHTPSQLQAHRNECGAVCLSIIMDFYAQPKPLARLRQDCQVSQSGCSASNIVEAAREHGFNGRVFSLDIDHLKSLQLPIILHWNFDHFVVLEFLDDSHVFINDPARGHRQLTIAEFSQQFTGIALEITPETQTEPTQKPNHWREKASLYDFFYRLLQPYIPLILLLLPVGIIAFVPGFVTTSLTRIFVDYVLEKNMLDWVAPLSWIALGAAILSFVIGLLMQAYVIKLFFRMQYFIKSHFFEVLFGKGFMYFLNLYAGEVVARHKTLDEFLQLFREQISQLATQVIFLFGFGLLALFYNPLLFLIGLIQPILLLWFSRYSTKKRMELALNLEYQQGRYASNLYYATEVMPAFKANGFESQLFQRSMDDMQRLHVSGNRLGIVNLNLRTIESITVQFTAALSLVLGAGFVIRGTMSVGELMAFEQALGLFSGAVLGLVHQVWQLQERKGVLTRCYDIFNETDKPVLKGSKPVEITVNPIDERYYFHARSLTYQLARSAKPIIHDVDLALEKGEWIGITGPSGSGKTTLLRSLAGLLPLNDGAIFIGHQNILEMNNTDRQRRVLYLPQFSHFFSASILDNITLFDNYIPVSKVNSILSELGLLRAIQTLSQGIDTALSPDGHPLSAGQRQRLAIASALCTEPDILIMDEPFSNIDDATERQIIELLRSKGITCIVSSHRKATLQHCDLTYAMRGGQLHPLENIDVLFGGK